MNDLISINTIEEFFFDIHRDMNFCESTKVKIGKPHIIFVGGPHNMHVSFSDERFYTVMVNMVGRAATFYVKESDMPDELKP